MCKPRNSLPLQQPSRSGHSTTSSPWDSHDRPHLNRAKELESDVKQKREEQNRMISSLSQSMWHSSQTLLLIDVRIVLLIRFQSHNKRAANTDTNKETSDFKTLSLITVQPTWAESRLIQDSRKLELHKPSSFWAKRFLWALIHNESIFSLQQYNPFSTENDL